MTRDEWEAELAEASALYNSEAPGLDKPAGSRRQEARDRVIAAQRAIRMIDEDAMSGATPAQGE